MTVLHSLIKEIDDNWEPHEHQIVDMIRSWIVRELPAEQQQIRGPNSEQNPDAVRRNEDDSSNEAGQTPDSLKQARERLRYREALEGVLNLQDEKSALSKTPIQLLVEINDLILKALQEEGK